MRKHITLLARLTIATPLLARGESAILSNILENKVVVIPEKDPKAEANLLIEIDLKSGERKNYPAPEGTQNHSAVAVFLDSQKLILISQWTQEGGMNPKVHVYDKKAMKWRSVGEIDCPSFDKVSFKKGSLSVNCESISPEGTSYVYQAKSLKTSEKFGLKGDFTLPLRQSESRAYKATVEDSKLVKTDKKSGKKEEISFQK